jgi:hypothetical protein
MSNEQDQPPATDPTRPGPAAQDRPDTAEPTVTDQDLTSPKVHGSAGGAPTISSAGDTHGWIAASYVEQYTGVLPPGLYSPITGSRFNEPTAAGIEEPTLAALDEPVSAGPDRPTAGLDKPTAPSLDGPTAAGPDRSTAGPDEPTATNLDGPTIAGLDESTVVIARSDIQAAMRGDVEATVAVDRPAAGEVTTTGPTVGGWPGDTPEPPPLGDLVWHSDPLPPPKEPTAGRGAGYYLTLGAAVVVVVGLIATAAFFTVSRPTQQVAGTAKPTRGVPAISPPASETPTRPPSTATTPDGPLSAIARHPLSASTTRMTPSTCALPRFDPADDRQVAFYLAAKKCADDAWRGILATADVPGDVTLVTVTATAQTASCGEVTPTSAATQCDGTVYMTPAHLRDDEHNDRYPGRYLGVFLREYAKALQFTTGLSPLVRDVTTGSAEDLDRRLAQQATCLAGVATGAMSGLGAVDTNITNEIRARLSEVDAPADAKTWLDKGFTDRTPAACNTWAD